MSRKPTYEELLQSVKALEAEKSTWLKTSANEAKKLGAAGIESLKQHADSPEDSGSLEAIINVEKLQSIMDDFYSLTGMVTAILDMDGNIIEATGWQDICTKFHRIHPETAQNCTESDLYLVNNIKPGEYIEYQCKNGLWDIVTPLYIGNKHMGNIYTGQFFYDDDTVDEKKFIRQAEKYGFDQDAYLTAFRQIPRYSRNVVSHLMSFLVKFASYISTVSYVNLKLEKEIIERKRVEASLRQSQDQLSEAMRMARTGHWEYDVENDLFTFNDQFYKIFRTTAEREGGYTMSSLDYARRFVHPDDSDLVGKEIKKCIETTDPDFNRQLEHRIFYADGQMGHISVRFFVVKDLQGRTIKTYGVNQDITERKKTYEAISRANEKMRLAADAAHLGIWNLDIKENHLEWDDWMHRLYGISRDQFSGAYEAWQAGVHPDDLERSKKEVEQALCGEKEFDTMFRIVRPDGKVRYLKAHANVSRDSQGNPLYMTGINYDITERMIANTALKESEERFKALHNASFGGITIHDKGLILECNKGLSEITGYGYDELIGMDGLQLISDDTREKVIRNIEAGYEKPYEAKGLRKNGEVYPLRLEARNIPYKGKSVRVVEFRDISENKRAEKEREELEGRLRQAQKMEAVGRLAGGVAHDFNNMLSVIIGNAEMALEQEDLPGPLYENLLEIKKAGERSADLTRQLLAFARKQTVSPKVLDLNATVTEITKMLQRLIGEDIELEWLPGKNIWPVRIDPGQIDQILANLCVNARDAIADVGKITIETGNAAFDGADCADHPGLQPGEYALLAVSDDGCGMDAEMLGNIFEPFFTTKESGKGTGLGLATVYGAVKQNDGFIHVNSEPGQGTTFKIYLPRYRARLNVLTEKGKDHSTERGHETILLVEDEPSILKMTTMMLERLGYRVVAVRTPGEAIRLAREYVGDIHLLLTDVIMPEMNGRDLSKSILSIFPNLERLFMSGYTADVIAHHGVLDEGVNFIQKPFSREQLGVKVREVLEKP